MTDITVVWNSFKTDMRVKNRFTDITVVLSSFITDMREYKQLHRHISCIK